MAFTRIVLALAAGTRFDLFGDGDQSRGWTYVSDVVDATVAAMARGEGTYNVGGALEASMNETIELLERISGRTLDVRRSAPVPGDQRRTSADTTRIRSELGWEPRVSLEDGLRRQWEWASSRVVGRMSAATDLGAEREIDLSRWRDALVNRWWLVAAGLVAGILVGGVYSLSGGSVWEASVLLSPGQAFSPNGSPVLVYQSSPRSINEIATSESALERAAAKAHTRRSASCEATSARRACPPGSGRPRAEARP